MLQCDEIALYSWKLPESVLNMKFEVAKTFPKGKTTDHGYFFPRHVQSKFDVVHVFSSLFEKELNAFILFQMTKILLAVGCPDLQDNHDRVLIGGDSSQQVLAESE